MNCLWLTNQWTLAHSCNRKYFQKTKTHRETCPNEPGEIFKILLFCIKNQNGGIFGVWNQIYSFIDHVFTQLAIFHKKSFIWWYRDIIKKIDNFLYAVSSIWKSLRVLEKARIKIVPRAIYRYLFFFFCKNSAFLQQNKKLLWSLFSLTN